MEVAQVGNLYKNYTTHFHSSEQFDSERRYLMRIAAAAVMMWALTISCSGPVDQPYDVANSPPTNSPPTTVERSEQSGLTPSPVTHGTPSTPATPTVAANQEQPLAPLPAATPLSAATVSGTKLASPLEPRPTPPPIPHAHLDYGGHLYPGWRGSYCWPVSADSTVCAESAGWRDFDEAPTALVNRGDGFKVAITGIDSSPDQVRLEVFPVVETEPVLKWGEQVYSIDTAEVPSLDVSEGTYFVSIFLKYHAGDVSYGFKVEIVHRLASPLEPRPTPPPIPHAHLDYGGHLYPGWRGSYCWPVSADSTVCAESAGWRDFDEAPTALVNRGDGFKVAITGIDSSPDQVRLEVFPVVETEPVLKWGEQVYSIDTAEVPSLDVSEGTYFVSIFLKYHAGDVSYGFKVEIVH